MEVRAHKSTSRDACCNVTGSPPFFAHATLRAGSGCLFLLSADMGGNSLHIGLQDTIDILLIKFEKLTTFLDNPASYLFHPYLCPPSWYGKWEHADSHFRSLKRLEGKVIRFLISFVSYL